MFFTAEKIERQLREVRAAIQRGAVDIPRWKVCQADVPGAQEPAYDDEGWDDLALDQAWGGYDVVAWFRARVRVPEEWLGKRLALRFLVGPRDGGGSTAESLLYVNGRPLQGIDVWHEEAMLPPDLARCPELAIAIRAWSGVLHVPERRRFRAAQLLLLDEATERFYYLADTVLKAAVELGEHDLRRTRLLAALNEAFHRLNLIKPRSSGFYSSVVEAEAYLRAAVDDMGSCREVKPRITGIGHSHLDMAWLWRLDHTVDKASRTFATVLNLMNQYPEYQFMHSSPQLYKLLAERYPGIYAQIKERIAEGRWEITGGMWVEADTNLTSGESLVRQFLLGKRLIAQEFGRQASVLWLPDVFGYSAALPQIARKSGFRFFLTSKISWNQFMRFPYDTFRWRGLDGSEMLTHFVTTPELPLTRYTYNGRLAPDDVKGLWDNYQQKAVNDELLMLFGWGDGGGGPTREMLESARVLANLPGIPCVSQGPAEAFFTRLEERLDGVHVPQWDGELYLEYHRGTYTSQAQIKRANRKAEILYHDAEVASALADVLTGDGAYPAADLRRGWERILLNQFHDILPGSSIRQVYEDCAGDYCWITELGEEAVSRAHARLLMRLPAPGPSLAVWNGLARERCDLVSLPRSDILDGMEVFDGEGRVLPRQVVMGDDGEERLLWALPDIPSLGYRTFALAPGDPAAAAGLTVTPAVLENRFYRLELNEQGQLRSLWDKRHGRQALAPGARGNVLQAFEDRPMDFDAWDIDIYYLEKMVEVDELVEAVVEEAGPLRGTLRLTWRFYDSTITQRLSLYAHSPRIDFRTEVDWQERQVLLKVAFPVNVRTTKATYDIQFGNLERPAHWNTEWDVARFEVVGHKWVDLSEGNYGVALLNDCKYGHDVRDGVLRLTLIKSAIDPDPEADRGRHVFTYSLLPHAGSWREGGVEAEAYALNHPLRADLLPGPQPGDLPPVFALATLDEGAGHVVLETVKQAEDGDGWVVRLYESRQYRNGAVGLTFGRRLRRAVECNLVEEGEEPVAFAGQTLTFAIAPYEIKTFRVWFQER
jgi:alpha-mannosidase